MNRTSTEENTTTKRASSLPTALKAKLYPNGECVVYKPRKFKPEEIRKYQTNESDLETMRIFRMLCENEELRDYAPLLLGLSPHTNFDSLLKNVPSPCATEDTVLKRYGRNGITSYGARRVRNGCHLIERRIPPLHAVFSTCTVPAMPIEDMRRLHQSWHHVVETFRRKLTRELRDNGLSGESVTVSEIQEKRYQRTGVPVLHLHTVFHGRRKDGKPAVTTERHDQMWRDALTAGVSGPVAKLGSACNLQWVNKSAEGYLGKYMSKGTAVVVKLCEAGFEGWLPKQWWSMSRSLGRAIDDETRNVDEFAETLNDWADMEGTKVWIWHRDVEIELFDGTLVRMARYGRLTNRQTAEIQAYYKSISAPSG